MGDRRYDVIVVGGGTMGTAAAWELGKRGANALLLEQFSIPHDKGAHGGFTRIIRHAYSESPDYVPLVQRADALWLDLEAATGESILVRCGGLELAAPGFSHASLARATAVEHRLPHEWLAPAEVRRRWPQVRVPDDWSALYSADAGFVQTEPAIRGMAAEARRLGVEIREREAVLDWDAGEDGCIVRTASAAYRADRLVITAGAWSGPLVAQLGGRVEVLRKVLYWLEVEQPERYAPDRFPVFISDSSDGAIYGFPVHGRPGLKIADHSGGDATTADAVDRVVRTGEEASVVGLAQRLFTGVTGRVLDSAVCLYAMSPDGHFIVDRLPGNGNVVVGAGFSGHGFKFATAVGEHLVDLVLDPGAAPLPILSFERLAAATS